MRITPNSNGTCFGSFCTESDGNRIGTVCQCRNTDINTTSAVIFIFGADSNIAGGVKAAIGNHIFSADSNTSLNNIVVTIHIGITNRFLGYTVCSSIVSNIFYRITKAGSNEIPVSQTGSNRIRTNYSRIFTKGIINNPRLVIIFVRISCCINRYIRNLIVIYFSIDSFQLCYVYRIGVFTTGRYVNNLAGHAIRTITNGYSAITGNPFRIEHTILLTGVSDGL